MNYRFLSSLFLVFALRCSGEALHAQFFTEFPSEPEPLPTASAYLLKGPVQSVEERYTQRTGEDGTEESTYRLYTEYDREGHSIRRQIEGEESERMTMDWTGGNLVTTIERENGRRLRKEYIIGSGGKVVEVVTRHNDGSPENRFLTDRDAQGNATRLRMYDSAGETIFDSRITYDSMGRKLNYAMALKGIMLGERYEHDSAGRIATSYPTIIGVGGWDRKTTYRYDSAGNIIQQQGWLYSADDSTWAPGVIITRSYDAYGMMILSESSDTADSENNGKYEYEYDTHGNWTKYITYKPLWQNGRKGWRPDQRAYRTIVYY